MDADRLGGYQKLLGEGLDNGGEALEAFVAKRKGEVPDSWY